MTTLRVLLMLLLLTGSGNSPATNSKPFETTSAYNVTAHLTKLTPHRTSLGYNQQPNSQPDRHKYDKCAYDKCAYQYPYEISNISYRDFRSYNIPYRSYPRHPGAHWCPFEGPHHQGSDCSRHNVGAHQRPHQPHRIPHCKPNHWHTDNGPHSVPYLFCSFQSR